MNLFISWSGETSKKLGESLNKWIPILLQNVKPFYTPEDIEKGSQWLNNIMEKLSASSIGIICLTSDNLDKPWILFEAGALSSKLDDAKVCPLVFGIPKSSVIGPLKIFQISEFEENDFKKLIKTINNQSGPNKIEDSILETSFAAFFPIIKNEIEQILLESKNEHEETTVLRSEKDLMEEIVENTRSLIKLNAETLKIIDQNSSSNQFMKKYYKVKEVTDNEIYKNPVSPISISPLEDEENNENNS